MTHLSQISVRYVVHQVQQIKVHATNAKLQEFLPGRKMYVKKLWARLARILGVIHESRWSVSLVSAAELESSCIVHCHIDH